MTSSNIPSPGQPDPAALLALGLATQAADASASSVPPLTPAELAAEFTQLDIIELLGRGGMGAVYKARQRDLDRLVALKILRPGLDADPGFAERFTREARALAQLNHPGIVTLYEFGRTTAGRYFILMEFVDGVNLRQLLEAGRLAPREALAIVPPLCDALQYAHDRGLIHRDIKPENLLIDRLGRIKIADFGIARLASERNGEREHPGSIEVIGTPHYMAPEQRDRPGEVDHRADLYALGVVFYQMLTGELPAAGQLQPPSTRVQLDVRLDEIVLRALEKDPARRYAAASDFKTQVETVASSPTPANQTPAATTSENSPRQRILHRKKAVAAAGLLFASSAVFVVLIWRKPDVYHSVTNLNDSRRSTPIASAQPSGTETKAITQAQDWLRTVDNREYAKSWLDAASSLRNAISQANWQAALEKARADLAGPSVSRQLAATHLTARLPGATDGMYFVIQYRTLRGGQTAAAETLTLVQEPSGEWRVAGYVIRPRTQIEKEVVEEALSWLADIDAGRFELSWDHAAASFQKAVSRDQWRSSLATARAPLGAAELRLIDITHTTTHLPGAPDGRYVVMTFNTTFERKSTAVETVTFEETKENGWRASGYYIK